MRVRYMIRRDMPRVLEIDQWDCVPWDEKSMLAVLRAQEITSYVVEEPLVSGDAEWPVILGFMVVFRDHDCYTVMKMGVDRDADKDAVVAKMMDYLIGKLRVYSRTKILVPVHERRLDLQLAMRACGFKCTSIDGEDYNMEIEYGTLVLP